MAENLFLLKRRIKTAKNISQIAKAMEMVSASKIKKAQIAVTNNKPYAQRITNLTQNLLSKTDVDEYVHPYITTAEGKRILLVVSSDKGLAGALNTNLLRKMHEYESPEDLTITIGRRAEQFAHRLGYNLIASFPMGTSIPSYSQVYDIIKLIEPYITSGEVTRMNVMFSEFISFFSQVPKVERILPIRKEENENQEQDLPFLVEPNISTILDGLLPHYVEVKLYQTLIEAYSSEQAARMIAMQNAKNNAQDVASYLTLAYNKMRQEKITNEILDLANASA